MISIPSEIAERATHAAHRPEDAGNVATFLRLWATDETTKRLRWKTTTSSATCRSKTKASPKRTWSSASRKVPTSRCPPEILRRQRGEDAGASDEAKSKRALRVLAGVAVVLVLLGAVGAGLGFTDYGFFGKFYLERYLPEAGDPSFARQNISRAEKTAARTPIAT